MNDSMNNPNNPYFSVRVGSKHKADKMPSSSHLASNKPPNKHKNTKNTKSHTSITHHNSSSNSTISSSNNHTHHNNNNNNSTYNKPHKSINFSNNNNNKSNKSYKKNNSENENGGKINGFPAKNGNGKGGMYPPGPALIPAGFNGPANGGGGGNVGNSTTQSSSSSSASSVVTNKSVSSVGKVNLITLSNPE